MQLIAPQVSRRSSLLGRRSIWALVVVAGSIAVLSAASGYVLAAATTGPSWLTCLA